MKTFKQYLEESNKTIVKNGIKITFHDDHVEYHKGPDLVHSHQGDYKNITKGHINAATGVAAKLNADSDHYKHWRPGKPKVYGKNRGL